MHPNSTGDLRRANGPTDLAEGNVGDLKTDTDSENIWRFIVFGTCDFISLNLFAPNGLSGSFATSYPRIFWFGLDTGETGEPPISFRVQPVSRCQRPFLCMSFRWQTTGWKCFRMAFGPPERGLKKRSDVYPSEIEHST